MKVAVTGATGFVGRHVLSVLLRQNVDVVAVTRNVNRLSDLNSAISIVEMDIGNPSPHDFERMGRPDVLIHLAWDGLPNYKSCHHFEAELPKQYRFIKGMVEAGLSKLLVSGTCFEYGMQSGPLSEEMNTQPTNSYGLAKDTLRKQLEMLRCGLSFDFTWVRLFYMYGEGQPDTSLYPKLKDAVKHGEKVFNLSGGEQLRDYLPVEEVAQKVVELAIEKKNLGVINICSGEPVSVRNLVEGWVRDNNWQIKLNLGYYPYPDYEPMAFWGDRSRLDQLA